MKPILEIQNISKTFRIQHEKAPYLSIRDSFTSLFRKSTENSEEFYALKDISFQVQMGESIGIIGKNGAGKSTLLKILSKITPPTSGKIISRGRIASLLEVGTGFHPELSGRENIFLNGSILGMTRREILEKFDEIVDFSGVERFIDTPLKHYSSGMQLRLAFSVAAFLEPEIMVIDEVLAVGDAEFQKKCMGKMEDVSKSGRTILFVSHNMAAVGSLCEKTLLIAGGSLKEFGPSHEVMNSYLTQSGSDSTSTGGLIVFPASKKANYISQVEFLCDGRHSELLYMGCEFEVIVHFKSAVLLEYPILGFILYDSFNSPLLYFNNKNYKSNLTIRPVKEGKICLKFPMFPLMSGKYSIDLRFGNLFEDLDVKKNIFQFQVESRHFLDTGELLDEKFNKFFVKDIEWRFESGSAF